MTRRPTTRDPLIDADAHQRIALDEFAQQLPVWGPALMRQHVMNLAEMYFWPAFLNGEPSTTVGTLGIQLHEKSPSYGSHCLSNPRFMWGSHTPRSSGTISPYSHSSHDDWNSEVPAVYWPLANRYDEPLRHGEGLEFWKTVMNHPRIHVKHQNAGNYASLGVEIVPSPSLQVEPWTPYFAAWMDLRERLQHNSAIERAMLADHHGERRHQASTAWTPSVEAPVTVPRRPRPR